MNLKYIAGETCKERIEEKIHKENINQNRVDKENINIQQSVKPLFNTSCMQSPVLGLWGDMWETEMWHVTSPRELPRHGNHMPLDYMVNKYLFNNSVQTQ